MAVETSFFAPVWKMTTLCKKRICLAASNIFDKWLGKDFKRERKGKTDTLPEVKGTPVNFSSKLKWKKLTVEPQRYIIQKVLSPTTTDLWCRPQRMGVWLTWCLFVEEMDTHFVVDRLQSLKTMHLCCRQGSLFVPETSFSVDRFIGHFNFQLSRFYIYGNIWLKKLKIV